MELVENLDSSVTVVNLDGGAIIQLVIRDVATPGVDADTIGVTVQKSKGGLWLSSLWDGSKTQVKTISAGDIEVK